MNCFCGMIDRPKTFSLISSRDHSQILTIANLQHAASRVWTCTEPEFRLSLIKFCSSDSYYTTSSLIGVMLWSPLCTCSWCYKDSHTFVPTTFWHYHIQQLQVVEHNASSFSLDRPWYTWSSELVSLMGLQFSSLPARGIVSWSSGTQGGFHQTHPGQHLGLIAVLLSCIIPQSCQSSMEEDAHPVFVSDDFLSLQVMIYICLFTRSGFFCLWKNLTICRFWLLKNF